MTFELELKVPDWKSIGGKLIKPCTCNAYEIGLSLGYQARCVCPR